ncbi:MAG: NAD(P)H-dependent glycerol-3-phosphate dehydrogenase, partial [Candidatus Zixiibacteriota bacterium]
PDQIATLSGPSHAEEVVSDLPTAVVAAGKSLELIGRIQNIFSNQSFRVYQTDDLCGVELGGSLKNIIAIAAGITAGLGMGDNTMGALITRGLAEITRLGVTMGARPETFAGLSGIGDLVTTCSSRHSRNRYVGEKIGQGMKLADVLAQMTMVAEGVETTRSGNSLAQKYDVEMPITREMYDVLFNDKPPAEAVDDLMGRKLKAEIWR